MLIALTGGIGCGKSTTLKIFKELNWEVFDSDLFCHSLYKKGEYPEFKEILVDRWGESILENDEFSRKKIAEIVFQNNKELKWINSIVHPIVLNEIKKRYSKTTNLICDIPLLFECQWENRFDKVISIWTNKEEQIKRLKQRNWSDEEISNRINSQLSNDIKLEKSDIGIINTINIQILKEQILIINDKLLMVNDKE